MTGVPQRDNKARISIHASLGMWRLCVNVRAIPAKPRETRAPNRNGKMAKIGDTSVPCLWKSTLFGISVLPKYSDVFRVISPSHRTGFARMSEMVAFV